MPRIHECTLSNGLSVFFRSKVDVDILSRELLLDDNLYLRNGITIKDGDCVFDIGANIGFFLLFLNQTVSKGRVFCFEPIPDVFEVLKLNAERHSRLDLKLMNCGLSKNSGIATFTYFPRTSVISSMFPDESAEFRKNSRQFVIEEIRRAHPLLRYAVKITPNWFWFPLAELLRRFFHSSKKTSCQLRTLSEVIREQQIEVIDLLKVDTEGAEEDVLAGLEPGHWIRIRQVVVEVHHGMDSLARMEHLLQCQGFKTNSEPVFPGMDQVHVVYARR